MTGGTILIVEDNTIQREGLTVVLRQQGFSVLSVGDGREALQLLDREKPDVVLLDMLISPCEGDGWWFLEQRRRRPNLIEVPVLITTALAVASKEWATSLGAAGLIRKPFEVEPLLAAIQQCIGQKIMN